MTENDFKAEFRDGAGNPIDGWRGISPIFTIINDKTIFLGTGFFITRNGLMLTAKHCLYDTRGNSYKTLFIFQFMEDNSYLLRSIYKSYWNCSDIAVLLPQNSIYQKTGKEPRNPVPTLTLAKPQIGEQIASFGYPKTIIKHHAYKKAAIQIDESWHFGTIEDYHADGTPLLKNPCFQTSMHILGGSSGGPVVNSNGKVFAINSTGADVYEGIKPYSFLTPIECCLDIEIDETSGEKYSIRKLIELNQILFEL